MNEHKKPRSNKAKNDKDSILADAKNLLSILYPALQRMPKIERIEGAPMEMKLATIGVIRHFSIAKGCPEERALEIRKMIGEFDRFQSTVNSYTGLLKNRTSYKRIMQLKDAIAKDWWLWFDWDNSRQCVVSKPNHNLHKRLRRKYKLKLRHI